jgi:hypothetical protein
VLRLRTDLLDGASQRFVLSRLDLRELDGDARLIPNEAPRHVHFCDLAPAVLEVHGLDPTLRDKSTQTKTDHAEARVQFARDFPPTNLAIRLGELEKVVTDLSAQRRFRSLRSTRTQVTGRSDIEHKRH